MILPDHGVRLPIAQPASGFDDFRSLANVDSTDNLPSVGFAVGSFLVGFTFSAEMGVQGSAISFILVDVLVDGFVANFLVMLEFEPF